MWTETESVVMNDMCNALKSLKQIYNPRSEKNVRINNSNPLMLFLAESI